MGTLMAETTLREAMHYARTAHVSDAAERGQAPILYMNGWDVFDALPQLWDDAIDQIPGTTEPLTASEYARLHQQWRMHADPDMLMKKRRTLCKLFVGPVGAITRIHQDNHNAHAWLCNLRGRKLYVLCRPADSDKVAPARALHKGLGTQCVAWRGSKIPSPVAP